MTYSLGVDLGTTFVAAAISHPSQIAMFALGDHSVETPAVVYLADDGTVITGEAASRRAVSSPERAGREFKRRLGDPTPVSLGGTPHAVTDLLGTLLRDVLHKVIETEGAPPEHVVLTHPANWGPFRRGLFEEVPPLAGLDSALTVTEPEAAAAHYATSRQLADGEIVAVYDLGGGTFDATVLRRHPYGLELLGTPEGIERLGGIDFDEAVLNFVNHSSGGALNELDMGDSPTVVALARLRQECVLAKEALSADNETTIPVFLPGRHFDVHMTRTDLEDLIRAQLESTITALARTLRSAQVTPDQLSAVLLVGGSSRIPLVARMVSEELGRPTVTDAHPKHAVALGAAALARLSDGRAFEHVGDAESARPLSEGKVLIPRSPPLNPATSKPATGSATPAQYGRRTTPSGGGVRGRTDQVGVEIPPATQYSVDPDGRDGSLGTASSAEQTQPTATVVRMLVTGMALLALAVLVAVIAFLVVSRLRVAAAPEMTTDSSPGSAVVASAGSGPAW